MKKVELKNFYSDNPKIKYSCAKEAMKLSEDDPSTLYPDFDFFVEIMNGKNQILKWNAILIIGNLSKIDSKNKIDGILPTLLAFLKDKSLITAANTIKTLGEIAKNKPQFQNEILKHLLKVETAEYYSKGKVSPECRNVAIQQVIASLSKFDKTPSFKKKVKPFLTRQTENSRPKVKKLAEQFLRNL